MLYFFLKHVLRYAVKSYFREIQLNHQNSIPSGVPILFLPNHRSAFMDPLVVSVFLNQKVHFLARGESFSNPLLAAFLKRLNVIPIYRKDKMPQDMHKNEEIFKHCYQLLEANGSLVIFPEGASQTKPTLLPLKTGAARISFGAEAKNNFKLGVVLIPVGINYTQPHHFQGKLFINYGKPIEVKNFQSDYENDPIQAVNLLTAHIENELKKLIVIADENRWHELIEKSEMIIKSDINRFGNIDNAKEVPWFRARKNLYDTVNYYSKVDEKLLIKIEVKVQQYFSIAHRLNLKEALLNPLGNKKGIQLNHFTILFYLLFGFPFFIIGLVLNIIPFYLTTLMTKRFVKDSDFIGSVLLIIGLFIFSLNTIALIWLTNLWIQNILVSLLWVIILPSIGLFTFQYYIQFKRWSSGIRLRNIAFRKVDLIIQINKLREEILKIFENAYNDYLIKKS